MASQISQAREHFLSGVSRIAYFWGFPKAMGAIYATIYLSPKPVTLDELVSQVGVSKGAVSTSVARLQRLQMVHKKLKVGDRKDYYTAETDFWKIVKSILKEREKHEFDLALRTVGESMEILDEADSPDDAELAAFYRERMGAMKRFFDSLDSLVAAIIALDDFRVAAVSKLFGKLFDSE
ncbi:DNA-binding transcriptional regulator GbsR, MarR family [Desulfatibacillum alkenivorans DSM 16219]|jgi:DNA-binding transcriptional regulator GbsR (MarR family)|uniref:HTH-type transcriptional regulator n=1 Tax=Desulfatibacillum alkenivorans DSM 16219 TaxID=1121393 RepID=A0A1M6FPX9_9BACT|nr:hypothetical protein [Desulfatibacillum alkenivorans]SHI99724.1 DNA-binding transcriptional regulator GbsR, MarR family [Desulfatibacillum alkenivorans DSM 16219]